VDWGPWLVTFIAGQASGLGIALAMAWVERQWRRQEARATEKRARLEAHFTLVRPYAAALQAFVEDAVTWMKVWNEVKAVEGTDRSRALLRSRLQQRWNQVQRLEPQPGPWFMVRDKKVKAALLPFDITAHQCHYRCQQTIDGTDAMNEEEANRFATEADQDLKMMLQWMEESLERLEA
jgi:hypothetical protein